MLRLHCWWSPLLRLLRTTSERNKIGVKKWHEQSKAAIEERDRLMSILQESSTVKFVDKVPESCAVTADQYDAGVIITGSPGSTEGVDANMGEVIVLGSPLETRTSFTRHGRIIRRVPKPL